MDGETIVRQSGAAQFGCGGGNYTLMADKIDRLQGWWSGQSIRITSVRE
jgi:hypothetical protein